MIMLMKIVVFLILSIVSEMGFAQEPQSDYIDSANLIFNQIDYAILNGNKDEVCKLQNEILQIAEKIEDQESRFLIYAIAINKYFNAKCYKEAITLSTESLDKARKCFGFKNKVVADFLRLLGFSYAQDGQIQQAIDYGKQSVQMFEEIDEVKDESYLVSVTLLTTYYNKSSFYPESISMLKRSLSLIELANVPPERLSIIYRALANNYSSLNNYLMAQVYTIKALDLYKDKQSLNYLGLKQNLAWLYSNNDCHEEAIQLINEVCDTLKILNESYVYANALSDKASIYIQTQDTNKILEALQFVEESANIFENAHDTLSNEYVHALMTKAEVYRSFGLYDNVQKIYKRVYNIQKNFLDISNIDDLEILSYSAVLANELEDGLSYFIMLKKQIIHERGEYSMDYADIKYRISELYYLLHDYEGALKNIMDVLPIMRNSLAKSFFMLEDNERAEFWNKFIYIFSESLPRMCYFSSDTKYAGLMFDTSLLSKGLLLNTERLKRKLMEKEASIDDFVKPFFLHWQDVQAKLKDDDIAIEFIKVNPFKNIPAYVAVTIRRQYEMPKLTTLFIEDEFKKLSDTLYYQSKDMADLVWKPLQSELEGIKNIYFSPSGALYNIGIEYLPGMENYNIYRLSSTRELVTGGKTEAENRAVLYGGLDYYAGFDTITNRKSEIKADFYIEHANVRGMNLRGGKELLPQTKIEVELIGKELKNAQWNCVLLTDGKGTEESFKDLSGKKIKTLHLSTHGFYYTKEEADNTGYDFLRLDNRPASAEDKALTRSGLILSGANHILERKELPDNVEDGILTAKEIADVDFRGLDLVVLSACQTGLGDISQSEGVFGLQRGFKKAGAHSMLMSLWKVDDEASQILMTQFYKNLLAGQSKRQSLLSAQDYLRKADGGKYDEPKYWGAFILLDGIK